MIVRISGTGQYELDNDSVRRLDQLDTALTDAYNARNEDEFRRCLSEAVRFVESTGKQLPNERVVPSDVIIPPEETGLEDAGAYMSDEGLMAPLEA